MGFYLADERLAGKVVAGVDTHADTHWLPRTRIRACGSRPLATDTDSCLCPRWNESSCPQDAARSLPNA